MRYAENVDEAVEQLVESVKLFHYENQFYRRLFSKRMVKEAWEILKARCQQLSQFIEHGCMTHAMKTELVQTLHAAEKVLLDHSQYKK